MAIAIALRIHQHPDVGYAESESYPLEEVDKEHHHHDHHHHHSHHLENDGFTSISFQSDRPFIVEMFQKFLDDLPENVFRAKGIKRIPTTGTRSMFDDERAMKKNL